MVGEACARCAGLSVIPEQLAWDADIREDFAAGPRTAVGQVTVPPEKFGLLVWDLTWLSRQDPWQNAAGDGPTASVAFFGRFEGAPFVVHDLAGRGPTFYVVGAPDLSGQAVLDAVFASLARRPWLGHREPGLLM